MNMIAYWAPTIVPFIIVLVMVGVAMRRQMRNFKILTDNGAAQIAELQKIGQTLGDIRSALEKRT